MPRSPWSPILLLFLHLFPAGCRDNNSPSGPGGTDDPDPAPASWIEVSLISRLPRLPAPTNLDAPSHVGWPTEGETVTWVGELRNRGEEAVPGVRYSWLDDGVAVAGEEITLQPGVTPLELPWTWTGDRHRITLRITPPGGFPDASLEDNQVTVASDALSIGFWVERRFYEAIQEDGRPGFEPWAQKEIEAWNEILGRHTYPSAPAGVLDRLRLDWVRVVDDGSDHPLNDGAELDTDFYWYFMNRPSGYWMLGASMEPAKVADQTVILHELLHQRGLTDLYAYNVQHGGPTGSEIGILESGRSVVGTSLMPYLSGQMVYWPEFNGIMGDQYNHRGILSEHSAFGLNSRAHLRTPWWRDKWGNLIEGFATGPYVNLIPQETAVRLIAADTGEPLPQASVGLFLDHGEGFYQDKFRPDPDFTFQADSQGIFNLPGSILQGTPTTTLRPKPVTLILRIASSRGRAYLFLPVYHLNILHFRGGQEKADLTLWVEFP